MARKAPKPKAPTIELIMERATSLPTQYQTQDNQIALGRRMRELAESTPVPDRLAHIKSLELHDATITNEIIGVVAALTNFPPKLKVTAADPLSDTGQKDSTLCEHWTMEIVKQAMTASLGQHAHEQIVDSVAGDGGAWFKLILDMHQWDEVWEVEEDEEYDMDDATGEEAGDETPMNRVKKGKRPKSYKTYLDDREAAKRNAPNPFRIICADVACIYPVWRGNELVEVLEITERLMADVIDEYGMSDKTIYGQPMSHDESEQYSQRCRHYEHWTRTHVTYAIDGGSGKDQRILKTIEHKYGFIPYYPAMGGTTNYWRGRKVGWPVGWPLHHLVRYRQFLWNLILNIAAQTAGTPIAHTRPETAAALEGEPELPEDEIAMIDLNGIYELGPGEKFEPIQLPGVPPAMVELLETLNAQIQLLATPRLSTAAGGEASGAGFALAQISAEIRQRYEPYARHVAEAYDRMTRDMWYLARKFLGDEEIPVRYMPINPKSAAQTAQWLTVTPNRDLKDAMGIAWEINAEPPTASIVRARYVHERMREGTLSHDQAIEMLGDNPDEVRWGLTLDRFRQEDFYKKLQDKQVMLLLEAGDLLDHAAEEALQTGQVPGVGPNGPLPPGVMPMDPNTPPGQPPMGAPPGGPPMQNPAGLAMAPGGQGAAGPPPLPPPGPVPGLGQAVGFTNNGAGAGMMRP